MTYENFKTKLSLRVFGDDLNEEILLTVLKNPHRYIGLFRISSAKTKLIQNITQSCEIKFGNFIEDILTEYIADMGYINLDKNIGFDSENNRLSADQIFKNDSAIYLIEQKIRDDHDSTKKRGQYANLIKKIKCLKVKFKNAKIKAIMWFSDDSLKKNRKYYQEQIENNTDEKVEILIFYGKELFEVIFNRVDIWDELISHLRQNKIERSKEILSIPDFDSSQEIRKSLINIKQKEPRLIKNLLSNKAEFVELRAELFPSTTNLKGL